MKNYSVLTALPLSFFSKPLYRDIGRNWRGIGFLYLLLLAAITWTPYTYFANQAAAHIANDVTPAIIAQLPNMQIVKGKLSTEKQQPYFIKDIETNQVFAIIDTTGRYTSLDNSPARLLVTADKFMYKADNNKLTIHSLSNVKEDYRIDRVKLSQQVDNFKRYFAPLFFALGLLVFFVISIGQALLCSITGIIFANNKKLALPYSAILRLAAVALTPVAIFAMVLDMLHITFPLQGLVKIALAIGYVYFAINANSESNQEV